MHINFKSKKKICPVAPKEPALSLLPYENEMRYINVNFSIFLKNVKFKYISFFSTKKIVYIRVSFNANFETFFFIIKEKENKGE